MDSGRVIIECTIILLWLNCTIHCFTFTNEIRLAQGNLKGVVNWTNGYKSYLGIPYASVVTRFQDAGPAPTWTETFLATRGSIKCNQYFAVLKIPIGQEDCLVVNIFTPINNSNNLIPVMVFIHGGGYYFGSNTDLIYNPKYLVKKNVIVVTINYRLGAFGFLCLHETEAPGNVGLKDQILALNWIKSNIKSFGGNPNAVTVFGESAGASSIHYMIISGKYKRLFTNAILQSGTALTPGKFDKTPIKSASYVASRMGYKTEDPNELLQIFQNVSADYIIKASHVDSKNQPLKPRIFNPCAESITDKKSYVLENPRKLGESMQLDPNLHILLGYNDKEGITLAGNYDAEGLEMLNSTLSYLIPENIKLIGETDEATLTQDIRKFYFQEGVTYDSLIDYFSDTTMSYPSIVSTNFLLSLNITVYNYYFKYDSLRNFCKFISGLPHKPGADHGDDLFYIFDPAFSYLFAPNDNDRKFIDMLTTLWTDFAKTGNPTATTIDWMHSKKGDLKFLQLNREVKMIPLPNKNRFQFWDRVYEKYASF